MKRTFLAAAMAMSSAFVLAAPQPGSLAELYTKGVFSQQAKTLDWGMGFSTPDGLVMFTGFGAVTAKQVADFMQQKYGVGFFDACGELFNLPTCMFNLEQEDEFGRPQTYTSIEQFKLMRDPAFEQEIFDKIEEKIRSETGLTVYEFHYELFQNRAGFIQAGDGAKVEEYNNVINFIESAMKLDHRTKRIVKEAEQK